jgi:hypothetical protein
MGSERIIRTTELKTGLIDIQDHGGGVWIKNLKIMEIK